MKIRAIRIDVICRGMDRMRGPRQQSDRPHPLTLSHHRAHSCTPLNVSARCKTNACKQVRNNSTVHVLAWFIVTSLFSNRATGHRRHCEHIDRNNTGNLPYFPIQSNTRTEERRTNFKFLPTWVAWCFPTEKFCKFDDLFEGCDLTNFHWTLRVLSLFVVQQLHMFVIITILLTFF